MRIDKNEWVDLKFSKYVMNYRNLWYEIEFEGY